METYKSWKSYVKISLVYYLLSRLFLVLTIIHPCLWLRHDVKAISPPSWSTSSWPLVNTCDTQLSRRHPYRFPIKQERYLVLLLYLHHNLVNITASFPPNLVSTSVGPPTLSAINITSMQNIKPITQIPSFPSIYNYSLIFLN